MKNPKLANRYANALFEMAKQEGKIEEVHHDIVLIKKVLKENDVLKKVIDSPHIPIHKKDKIFIALFDGKMSLIAEQFLLLIIKKRRVPDLYCILDEFVSVYNRHNHIKIAKVTVSDELNSDFRLKITAILESEFQSKIILKVKIDPNIIGGIIIKVDDILIDASISSKISRLKNEFSQNKYKVSY
ncbi:MAG TPA: ATP synthase F1 subunit delta [Bacteroidales bacterium]|nr:ATP synthase F1 subunit delta [Bacteroidales bacterium]